MNEFLPLLEVSELSTTKLREHLKAGRPPAQIYYDDLADHLIVGIVPTTSERIVHYLDSYMALLYEGDTKEIVGFQIESFEYSFIKQHPALNHVWHIENPCPEDISNFGAMTKLYHSRSKSVCQQVGEIAAPKMKENGLQFA